MKTIPLTQGKFALVNNEDFNWLNQWKWFAHKSRNTYYAYRNSPKEFIAMHRLILGLRFGDGVLTDHKDYNGLNNQRYNLRICTKAQNQCHKKKYQGIYSSKYKGVTWDKRIKKWQAQLGYHIDNKIKIIYLGLFTNEIGAAKCYDRKAKEVYGEFAHTNFQER